MKTLQYEKHTINERLQFLYGKETAKKALDDITKLILHYNRYNL